MSVPQQPALAPDGPHPGPATNLPVVGSCWQRVYQIDAQETKLEGSLAWMAHRIDTEEPISILSRRDNDPCRGRVWEALHAQQIPSLQQALTAHSVGNLRIEAYSAPPPLSLRAWRQARPSIDAAQLHTLVHEMAEAIHRIHQLGIVHFNISPDTIFLTDHNGTIHPVLAGLGMATLFDQKELIPIEPNPFYAPPEAAGLTRHAPGHPLCAWDWWALGRVVQELILGKHIIGLMLNRDVDFTRPEFRAAAENLIQEQDRSICRAGGLELMPLQNDREQSLLRGFLASARDGRWCYDDVAAWLRGETVRDHYQMRRRERLFRYRNRAYTPAEAGDALRTPANWPHIVEHVYEPQKTDTFAHFIRETPGMQEIQERMAATLALAEDETLRAFPGPLVREVVASLALLQIAGNRFTWRGHPFDTTWLQEWLGRDDFELAVLQLFTAPVILYKLKSIDPTTGRILAETHDLVEEALALCREGKWIHPPEEPTGIPRLWALAIQPPATLPQTRTSLHQRFAISTQPAMEQIFQNAHPTHAQLIVLAWVEHHIERGGFVTHETWAQQQYELLDQQGRRIAAHLFWLHLGKALRAGPWIFGKPYWFVLTWGIIALLISLVHPGPLGLFFAILPALTVAGLRFGATAAIRAEAARHAPQARPWKWSDGPARCTEEHADEAHKNTRAATSELHQINTKIDLLANLPNKPAPVPAPSRMLHVWAASIVSGALLVALIIFSTWRLLSHLPDLAEIKLSWSTPIEEPEPAKIRDAQPMPAIDDTPAKPVKVSWPFRAPLSIQPIEVLSNQPASEEQLATALQAGLSRVAEYKPETISALVAIPLTSKSGTVLILFDGAQGKLRGKTAYSVSYHPAHRSWILIENIPAIVLAE